MSNVKSTSTLLADHFPLSSKMCFSTLEEANVLGGILYSSIVCSLMYKMVSTHPDIAHVVKLSVVL